MTTCINTLHNSIYLILLFIFSSQVFAEKINIAVASNFKETITNIARLFESRTSHQLIISSASSGKHFAQIQHGAPFDIFFSADSFRAKKLEATGHAVPDTRFTYAIGKLTLWNPKANTIISANTLENDVYRHLAIANPKLAPYGIAAKQTLSTLGLWEQVSHKIVRGENISQTFQFVSSGNAELGFVALSQIKRNNLLTHKSYWLVPQTLYTPIEQQAVLLNESQASRDFLSFMRSESILEIIQDSGYDTP